MSNKTVKIDTNALAKLLQKHFKDASKESMNNLFDMVIRSAGDKTGNLINYLENPAKYIDPESNASIGSTILVDKTCLWSTVSKYYEDNNLLIDDKWFSATVIGFNFLKSDCIEIKYPDHNGKSETREIYPSYINKENLL
jgi:hypothetical protein